MTRIALLGNKYAIINRFYFALYKGSIHIITVISKCTYFITVISSVFCL